MTAGALSYEQASEMLGRYHAGIEPVSAIAAAFGVSIGYPAKLARRRGQPVRRPHASATVKSRGADTTWRPQPEPFAPSCAPGAGVRARLSAGEPMLVIAADLDIGLGELVAAARSGR